MVIEDLVQEKLRIFFGYYYYYTHEMSCLQEKSDKIFQYRKTGRSCPNFILFPLFLDLCDYYYKQPLQRNRFYVFLRILPPILGMASRTCKKTSH